MCATERLCSAAGAVVRPRAGRGRASRRITLLVLLVATAPAAAATYRARVRWTPSRDTTVRGYRVWVRAAGGAPTGRDAGTPALGADGAMAWIADALDGRTDYVVSVSGYRADGSETPRSNEIASGYAAAAALIDSDGDGLSDAVEDPNLNRIVDAGETDATRADSDGDGVGDRIDACVGTATGTTVGANGCACGNGYIDAGEECDDGNAAGGDCCTPGCRLEATPCDLTAGGTIVSRITSPTGVGSRSLEVIRDGDRPPLGTTDPRRQFDTYDGVNNAAWEWIGYQFARPQRFTAIVFQEGLQFGNGGWFDFLHAQVRQNGAWLSAPGLTITPAYPKANGVGFETYTLRMTPVIGDAIRLAGTPGGSAQFVSVAELRVLGGVATTAAAAPEVAPRDVTPLGTIIARVSAPSGEGSRNLEVIRDGDTPPVGSADSRRQYDTYDGDNTATDDWIGYTFAAPQVFTQVVFQEGRQFPNGGWLDSLAVQVRQGGQWMAVPGLTVSPAYPGANGVSFETITLGFPATTGDGVRLAGRPGGSADFISVGELRVFASG